jgi:hypothetical protein
MRDFIRHVTSAADRDEWSTAHAGRFFTTGKSPPATHGTEKVKSKLICRPTFALQK